MTAQLHVPSLSIEGFRGIRSLSLPRQLGRVTLLAGENGVGKTTVLDAFRFYAARGDGRVLASLLDYREEFITGVAADGNPLLFPDFRSLFHAPDGVHEAEPIRIRSEFPEFDLSVRLVEPEDDAKMPGLAFSDEGEPKALQVSVGERFRTVHAASRFFGTGTGLPFGFGHVDQSASSSKPWPSTIRCESRGPELMNNDELARLWDSVALTDGENLATEALRLVIGEDMVRLAVVGDNSLLSRPQGRRRAVAKLRSHPRPVPLKRLGDGANRLLAIALALGNARDGILLIDEAENGIHYSIQTQLWQMVFRAAVAANVQVVAATHSWDCIAGFAAAAVESPELGTMFRLERFGDELQGVLYTEENLQVAARQRIEVR